MQYHLLPTLDYLKSAYIILEQARLMKETQVVVSKRFAWIIYKYWSSIQFYTNNIARFLGIGVILSSRRQYHQLKTLIKCPTFLQVKYLQITTAFKKPLIFYQFQSNIQPSINQASGILSISEHYPAQHSTSLWPSMNFRAK